METSGEYKSETGCVCPLSGFCSRHGIRKNAHFHKLCQTRQDYFDMYEKCIGPGQEFTNCDGTVQPPDIVVDGPDIPCPSCNKDKDKEKETENNIKESELTKALPEEKQPIQMPSLWEQAKNLTKATVTHVASGMGELTSEEQQARLDLCGQCQFFDNNKKRCGKCGCMMLVKTKWPSASCPIGLWGPGRNVK